MTLSGLAKQFRSGIVDNNPVLIQLLGMCPTLATTTSVSNAIGMGLAATVVLTCSNILISLLRKFIPKQVRIAVFIVIISGFVTAVELLMKAYFYELYGALGIFLPLIVVNCIILARAEAFASKNPVLPSAIDGLSCGIGFTLALIVVASIRELLGNGTFLGFQVFGENYPAAVVFILPAGAFLTLGCVIAAVQTLKNKADAKKSEKEAVAEAVANAAQAAAKEVQE
ncbi:MAG: electron transport complex subunit E [Clostridiales bacterium]|jgi:electron transport complex protein RnfE|nr:electron transport complex subunit E [Clostridiales bacterium]